MAMNHQIEAADTHGRLHSTAVQTEHTRAGSTAYLPYMTEEQRQAWRIEQAEAEWRVRRLANQHDCSRRRPSDPPCQNPRHVQDWADCRQALIVLGILPDDHVLPRTALGVVSHRATSVRCGQCGYRVQVRRDGMLTAHSPSSNTTSAQGRCPGSGQPPTETDT